MKKKILLVLPAKPESIVLWSDEQHKLKIHLVCNPFTLPGENNKKTVMGYKDKKLYRKQ
jgi:hypothetical protein